MTVGRRTRWAALAGVTLIGVSAGLYFGLDLALHASPDFYGAALAVPIDDQQQAGRDFERKVLDLHNDLQQSGPWRRVFSEKQVNGWLAVDLPEKFPELLAESIREPRVLMQPNQLQVAFQYEGERLSTIINLVLKVGLADSPNTVSLRVCSARAGWVPLPLRDFLGHISDAARRSNIQLRWAQDDGDPVALITLPHTYDKDARKFVLELIEIGQGGLTVAGRSEKTRAE